jgi:hypothetical protein
VQIYTKWVFIHTQLFTLKRCKLTLKSVLASWHLFGVPTDNLHRFWCCGNTPRFTVSGKLDLVYLNCSGHCYCRRILRDQTTAYCGECRTRTVSEDKREIAQGLEHPPFHHNCKHVIAFADKSSFTIDIVGGVLGTRKESWVSHRNTSFRESWWVAESKIANNRKNHDY